MYLVNGLNGRATIGCRGFEFLSYTMYLIWKQTLAFWWAWLLGTAIFTNYPYSLRGMPPQPRIWSWSSSFAPVLLVTSLKHSMEAAQPTMQSTSAQLVCSVHGYPQQRANVKISSGNIFFLDVSSLRHAASCRVQVVTDLGFTRCNFWCCDAVRMWLAGIAIWIHHAWSSLDSGRKL